MNAALVVLFLVLLATLNVPRLKGQSEAPWLAWPGYLWLALAVYLALIPAVLDLTRAMRRRIGRVVQSRRAMAMTAPEPASAQTSTSDGRFGSAAPSSLHLSRRVFLARSSAAAAATASVGLVAVGAATALGPPPVLHVPIHLRRLGSAFNGFRIAVVSDIHLGALLGRAHTERLVNMINDTDADLIAVVGDVVDASVAELGRAAEPLRDLVSREGTLFRDGQPRGLRIRHRRLNPEIGRLGIHVLRNANMLIRRGAASLPWLLSPTSLEAHTAMRRISTVLWPE
jgi:hypothetical protein